MPADYLTTDDYAARRELKNYGESDKDALEGWLTAASRWVDNACMVEPGAFQVSADAASTRYYQGSNGSEQWIPAHVTVTALAISPDNGNTYYTMAADTNYWTSDGAEYGQTPIRLLVLNPNGGYPTFWKGIRSVKVTGKRGISNTAPEPVKEAVAHIAHELVMRRRGQAEGDRMVVTGSGFIIPAQAIPPIVHSLLKPYQEHRT